MWSHNSDYSTVHSRYFNGMNTTVVTLFLQYLRDTVINTVGTTSVEECTHHSGTHRKDIKIIVELPVWNTV